MALITCYDCGASISDSAGGCPKCRTYFPSGVQCVICGDRMKASAHPLRNSSVARLRHMHSRCGERLFDRGGRCRDCGATIWGGWGSSWVSMLMSSLGDLESLQIYKSELVGPRGLSSACGKCGARDPLNFRGLCTMCRLPVFGQLDHMATDREPLRHKYCQELRG